VGAHESIRVPPRGWGQEEASIVPPGFNRDSLCFGPLSPAGRRATEDVRDIDQTVLVIDVAGMTAVDFSMFI